MRDGHVGVLKAAIANRAAGLRNPDIPSKWTFGLAVVVCCIEIGDTKALKFWIERVRANSNVDTLSEDEAILQAAEYALGRWERIEAIHGQGAVMNYRLRLNHSPAQHIGLVEIGNAARFQSTKPYDVTDRTYALEYL